jgi:hypothetical protein
MASLKALVSNFVVERHRPLTCDLTVPSIGRVARERSSGGTMNTVSGPDTVFIVPPDGSTKAQAPLETGRRYLKTCSTDPKTASFTDLINFASEEADDESYGPGRGRKAM